MTRTNSSELRTLTPMIVKQAILWFPIMVGFIHQFLMFLGISKRIYVFVSPPEYIYPFVTLEFQWWVVLLFGSFLAFVVAYLDRVQSVPSRFSVPFYAYILFLLILVKPV